MKPVPITKAAPIRVMSAAAWIVKSEGDTDLPDLLILVAPEFRAHEVVELVKNLHPEYEEFTVQHVSVGSWQLMKQKGDAYFNDARKVDQDGMVQL